MKSFLTLPTDKDFFQRYAVLVPTLFKLGFFSQLISALTEFGVIYAITYKSTIELSPENAHYLAFLGGCIGTLFLEIGLRKFLPFGVKAFLYKRFKGLDLLMSIFIVLTCVGLLFASGYLSFKNSSSIIEAYTPPPLEKNHAEATEKKNLENVETWNTYRADSVATFTSYNAQTEAKKNEYQSKIDIKTARINRYKRKSERDGLSYKSKILLLKQNIAELEAERDEILSILSIKETAELKTLLNAKNKSLSSTKTIYEKTVANVDSFNETEKSKSEMKIKRYGLGLGWFTLFCLIILVLSITLNEIHKKGSGINDKVLVSQYHFSGGIVSDFLTALSDRMQQRIRTGIANIEKKTLAPPLPVVPSDLYDLSELQNDSVKIKVEEKKNNETKVIYLQTKERTYDNRRGQKTRKSNDTKIVVKEKKRTCEHCGSEYTYNHAKQKYCADACRIKAWEQRNGKKLSKRKAK